MSGPEAKLEGSEQVSEEKTIENAIGQRQCKDNLNDYSTGDTLQKVQKGKLVDVQNKQFLCWLIHHYLYMLK